MLTSLAVISIIKIKNYKKALETSQSEICLHYKFTTQKRHTQTSVNVLSFLVKSFTFIT